jgi:hypothetical protein
MRLRFVHVSCTCLAALLPIAVTAELSQKVRAEIVAPLPVYTPPPPEAPKPIGTPAPLSDDPLVSLPNYHVEDKRVPVPEPDQWLAPAELQKKQLHEYKKSMTPFAWLLNCWFVPPFSAPASVRAKADYDEKRMQSEFQRLNYLADVIAKVDPAEAKRLKISMDLSKLPKD